MRLRVSEAAAAPRRGIAEDWLAAALIVGFFLVNLIGLDRVPFANADEAWIAEPGLRFWERGAFVSQLHAGFFGVERHYLLHAPLFSLITGDREKFFFYLAALWPWIALTAAIGIMTAVQSTRRIISIAAIALLTLGCLDGVRAEVDLAQGSGSRVIRDDRRSARGARAA
jgi:hypothetical protein